MGLHALQLPPPGMLLNWLNLTPYSFAAWLCSDSHSWCCCNAGPGLQGGWQNPSRFRMQQLHAPCPCAACACRCVVRCPAPRPYELVRKSTQGRLQPPLTAEVLRALHHGGGAAPRVPRSFMLLLAFLVGVPQPPKCPQCPQCPYPHMLCPLEARRAAMKIERPSPDPLMGNPRPLFAPPAL